MDDEVHVLPDVVVVSVMKFETLIGVSVKGLPFNAANEADIPIVIVRLTLLVSQLGKGIDDDTEDDVQQDCDHQEEERQVIG